MLPLLRNRMDHQLPAPSLAEQRDRTVAALCRHFAADRLELADFETRLDGVHQARTPAELSSLLADLPPLRPEARAAGAGEALGDAVARGSRAVSDAVRDSRTLVAFMGGVERRGHWQPARRNLVVAVMGGASLDFREVSLPPGETEVVLFCFMGGAEIIVPPGLAVDASGIAIMGGFEHASPPPGSGPDAAVLKLTGVAIMGGVEVSVRAPGESGQDARRRERQQRRTGGQSHRTDGGGRKRGGRDGREADGGERG
jgi:hypothetical protein